jgi:hypothetical protein
MPRYPFYVQRLMHPDGTRARSFLMSHTAFVTDILPQLFRLDDMDSSVFESGMLDVALKSMWLRRREYVANHLELDSRQLINLWAIRQYIPEITDFIVEFSTGDISAENPLCRPLRLRQSLAARLNGQSDTKEPIAWLCLDDPSFMLTLDMGLFRKFVKLMKDDSTGALLDVYDSRGHRRRG